MITYLTREKIARLTGRKREWVRNFINGMKASGRYSPDDVIEDGRLILVSSDAFTDWLMNRKKLKNGELVSPYERRER